MACKKQMQTNFTHDDVVACLRVPIAGSKISACVIQVDIKNQETQATLGLDLPTFEL